MNNGYHINSRSLAYRETFRQLNHGRDRELAAKLVKQYRFRKKWGKIIKAAVPIAGVLLAVALGLLLVKIL